MILIGIGANLTHSRGMTPLHTCQWAVAQLGKLPGMRLRGVSEWYDTVPIPPSGQPAYINGVAALEGEITPEALLRELHAIEAAAGRVRGAVNAARTLDLDIVDFDGLVRDYPDPVLPHPRAHLRAFVLYPVRDLAPDWVHPVSGQAIDTLIAAVSGQDIRLA